MHPRTQCRPMWQNPIGFLGRAKPTVESLAQSMRDLNAEGEGCTEETLVGVGYPRQFVRENAPEATQLASGMFVRQDGNPEETEEELVARMRIILGDVMPTLEVIKNQMTAHGITKRNMDYHLLRVVNLAARDFVSVTQEGRTQQ